MHDRVEVTVEIHDHHTFTLETFARVIGTYDNMVSMLVIVVGGGGGSGILLLFCGAVRIETSGNPRLVELLCESLEVACFGCLACGWSQDKDITWCVFTLST